MPRVGNYGIPYYTKDLWDDPQPVVSQGPRKAPAQAQIPSPTTIENPNPNPNPNTKKNRVPTTEERRVLKDLVAIQQRISTFINERQEELKKKRDELGSIEQNRPLEREGIQSAIIQTESMMGLIGKHAALCKERVQELDGLLHPIRTCPEDIIRLIFECVVDDSNSRLTQAKRLSHVCSL